MTTGTGIPGFVLGGTRSGVGKTVGTLSVIRALEAAGYVIQPAKAGPDFIDPSHHTAVAGVPSRTLDSWLQGEAGLRRNYHRGDGDICVVEGVMGLYDGDRSSTARVAEILDLPVVLVVDAKAGMESVAATAFGFQQYAERIGREIEVAGVLVQRAHGGRHEAGIRDALPEELRYFGRIPPTPELEIPDRHLGLELGSESPLDTESLDEAAEHIHAAELAELARSPPPMSESDEETRQKENSEAGPRIAVADDDAFCFTYPATVERFRQRGRVVSFSPVDGDSLPECDGVYLPGGYPELHAAELAECRALDQLASRAAEGLPIYGECGGLMALSETLTTADGETHEMAGILPATVEMHDRYQALDHVELHATRETLTAAPGTSLRGHEFHYSTAMPAPDAQFAFDVRRGDGITDEQDGLTEYQTLGTYCHLHPESGAFDSFLDRIGQQQ